VGAAQLLAHRVHVCREPRQTTDRRRILLVDPRRLPRLDLTVYVAGVQDDQMKDRCFPGRRGRAAGERNGEQQCRGEDRE